MKKPTQREQMAYSTIARLEAELAQLKTADGWIKCSDRLPLTAADGQSFETVEVLVTDGVHVHCTEFKAGGIPVAWTEFDGYGAIARSQITHWQPLPAPPTE